MLAALELPTNLYLLTAFWQYLKQSSQFRLCARDSHGAIVAAFLNQHAVLALTYQPFLVLKQRLKVLLTGIDIVDNTPAIIV